MNFDYLAIDIERLKCDIRHLIADCIRLKGLLRTRWERPMADEQRRHVHVRRKLTERLVLFARVRGKEHVVRRPHALAEGDVWDATAWNTRVAERLAPDYARAATRAQLEAAR